MVYTLYIPPLHGAPHGPLRSHGLPAACSHVVAMSSQVECLHAERTLWCPKVGHVPAIRWGCRAGRSGTATPHVERASVAVEYEACESHATEDGILCVGCVAQPREHVCNGKTIILGGRAVARLLYWVAAQWQDYYTGFTVRACSVMGFVMCGRTMYTHYTVRAHALTKLMIACACAQRSKCIHARLRKVIPPLCISSDLLLFTVVGCCTQLRANVH